ncbi:UDP-N-acetylmuramate--L-alanine ligase [Cecembia lonarensis]|uniref:UDP-N-acetylmuramate--L-alanine ligase n=1 Tax=Cecembia lonarensis (strain CCUG 58316 / KCTC 22772 / LW9) TaxID=1225176 RepID=K1L8R5_CECL9|nr:UDP-N-acetylmuramate--L-alanine ligase [Cecembia lonarensis]EKB51066.1 UDP-N-acetylmuramate--L-alanine ligase [Cecembia lonarensis LW9]
MNLNSLHSVHFLGIGGIGMSALARWFNHIGVKVSGYDRTPSPLTAALESEGMEISYVDQVATVPTRILDSSSDCLIIWTPAMPKDSVQLNYFRKHAYNLKKRAEVLGLITSGMPSIAVAGTHGKTTTSSMIAHLLKSGGKNIAAFLGGVTQNYNSNLILHDEEGMEARVVVEADEFDRSFLHLHPNVAVLTSADPDHLDIYGDDAHMMEGFRAFVALLPENGCLYIQHKAFEKLGLAESNPWKVKQYGVDKGDIRAENVQALPGIFRFDFLGDGHKIIGLSLRMPGFHNVENALAAIAIALDEGLSEEQIREGLSSYRGVKRRFEIWVQEEDRVFIDDYAHHPEEIRAFLTSVKAMYPDKKLTAVFQPHLFTRTRDFAEGFSESLSLADEVVLLDIYPARELPIEGVSASMLLDGIRSPQKSLQTKEGLLDYLGSTEIEVLVTIGAGDIDRLVEPLANWMKTHENQV